jgi:hypothetical protein
LTHPAPQNNSLGMVKLLPILFGAACVLVLPGCDLEDLLEDSPPGPTVVYVREPYQPVYYDPFYNQVKVYPQPQYLYETQSKKTKGNKVTKTKTIKNQFGETVYKEKTTHTKKKKK